MHFLQQFLSELELGKFIGLAIPVVAILVGGAIAIAGMYFHNQRRALWHETARVALEKGQPLPPFEEGDEENGNYRQNTAAPARPGRNDIRAGLILIAVGGGLYLFLSGLISSKIASVAAIPGFIGVALLLCGLFSPSRDQAKSPGAQPPMT